MANTKDIILRLKQIKEEKELSYNDILALMEKNGDFLAKSTISRVFSDGSEELSFRYEETIRPIAKALLDIETIEETDNMDTQAMKSLLMYKMKVIEDLEDEIRKLKTKLDKERISALEQINTERERFDNERAMLNKYIDKLSEQVDYKDKRMDFFLEALKDKDELLKNCMCCTKRKVMPEGE